MPTYEYRREDGSTFDVIQRFSDPPLELCPETGQKVKRLIGGGSGLIFKGSGFYLTDYVRKNGNGDGGEKKESAVSSDSKTEGKSESKSGSAKDTKASSTADAD